jgi:pimeloyl-ACP methyl ester carboxylesterase
MSARHSPARARWLQTRIGSERGSPHDVWPLETLVEDFLAVLDSANSERALFLATDMCGSLACVFAATYPERTAGLVLYETAANYLWSEETPWSGRKSVTKRRFGTSSCGRQTKAPSSTSRTETPPEQVRHGVYTGLLVAASRISIEPIGDSQRAARPFAD